MKIKTLILGLALLLSVASAFAQSGTAGPLTWDIKDNTLIIRGEGVMPDYGFIEWGGNLYVTTAPWGEYFKSITTVVIEEGVTGIGKCAFLGCSSVTSFTIPNTVTTIEGNAFFDCFGFFSITLPNSITKIERGTFYRCIRLYSITVPENVTSIGNRAFAYCNLLSSITIPESVTTIGDEVFFNCRWLPSITLPNSVTSIGNWAFFDCENLTSITLSNSIMSIGKGTFEGCWALPSITIPNGVTSIGDKAFYNCKSLTLITNLNPVPVAINSGVFGGVNKSACTLEVPINSVSAYKSADVWKEFNIVGVEVGVDELPITNYELRIYPNPTTGKVYTETESDIKVYNQQGELLQETFGNQVDLSDYPKGVYLLQVNGAGRKVIKQ